jgi:hypothetical protein
VIEPKKGEFFKEILRHEDKLTCQNIYFSHYSKLYPELLLKTDDLMEGQVLGHCFIHPTADIHPTAVVILINIFEIIILSSLVQMLASGHIAKYMME